jgi:hypothetical protein
MKYNQLKDEEIVIMKIEFNDKGATATATITSTVFEFRRHNRAVETTLFLAPAFVPAEPASLS